LTVFDIIRVREAGRYAAARFAAVIYNILGQFLQLLPSETVHILHKGTDTAPDPWGPRDRVKQSSWIASDMISFVKVLIVSEAVDAVPEVLRCITVSSTTHAAATTIDTQPT
jgi:hypothetical protein